MITALLIIGGILLEIIVIIFGVYFVLKYFKKPENLSEKIQVKVDSKTINAEVIRDGVKAAMRELTYENEQEKLFIKKMKQPEQVYSNLSSNDEPVKNSGGYLVPFNLNDEEKAMIEMFYGRD